MARAVQQTSLAFLLENARKIGKTLALEKKATQHLRIL
jgi:hypothetical protein